MGIKIKNLQTGEFEKFNIPALKGEKGEPGEIEPSEKVDYIGKQHSKLRDTMNANVDYIIKTAIGEFNYLDYEGQHITATNSIEGHAKSAILSGQTLVNLSEQKTMTMTSTTSSYVWINHQVKLNSNLFKAGQKYLFTSKYSYTNKAFDNKTPIYFILRKNGETTEKTFLQTAGKGIFTIPTNFETTDTLYMRVHASVGTAIDNTVTCDDIKILEYQDGMENWDIPYFEGMQSVKMPVLTTTGKNLFDINGDINQKYSNMSASKNPNLVNGTTIIASSNSSSHHGKGQKIKVERGEEYTCSFSSTNGGIIEINTPLKLNYVYGKESTFTFTAPTDCDEIIISFSTKGVEANGEIHNFQLEQGTKATPYEPYKSNTLSTPEDLELRGIGNVKDELNVATGELTQRIGEIVLDGSEDWSKYNVHAQEGYTAFITTIKTLNNLYHDKNINFISADFPTGTWHDYRSNLIPEFVWNHDPNKIGIRVRNEIATDVNGIKAFLSANNIKINYKLATPVVKTVDLSDNVVYSYSSITHYSCSSEDGSLVPTLSVKVPTDTQLTIQEQKATTQTLLIKNMDLQQSIKEVQAMNLAFNTALYNSFNSIREEVEDIKKYVSTNENLEGSF